MEKPSQGLYVFINSSVKLGHAKEVKVILSADTMQEIGYPSVRLLEHNEANLALACITRSLCLR